jgi:trimeric autotransporter adhesin
MHGAMTSRPWSRVFRSYKLALWCALCLVAATLCRLDVAEATTTYTYDALGRVTQVVESDGTTTQYTYDANGNVLSINRVQGSDPFSVTSVSAGSAAVGATVTITGTGFSTLSSQDTISFNGVPATILYSSGTRIVAAIPNGATSGPLAVTSPNGTAVASSQFAIVPVSISNLTPLMGVAGSALTVFGGGFDPNVSNDSVTINGFAASVSSAGTTQLQVSVPSGATPGHIALTTTLGTAVSSGYFFIPAAGFTLSQVVAVDPLPPGGTGPTFTTSRPSQVAVGLFDGTVGQQPTLTFANVTMGAQYQIFAPDGSQLTTGPVTNNTALNLPPLSQAGTYALYLESGASPGSATVTLLNPLIGTVPTNGTPTPEALLPGQNALLTFAGVAGQSYSLELTQFSTNPSGAALAISILNPDGTLNSSCGQYSASANPTGNCDFTLGASGTFTIQIQPSGALASSSFSVLLNQDFSATLSAGTPGPTVNVNLVPGQHAQLQFTATSGQTLALYLGSIAITPSNATVSVTVTNSSGGIVATGTSASSAGITLNLPNLAADTYSALIIPNNASGGSASMQVALANGVTGTVSPNGSAAFVQTWVPGQAAYLSFSGTAGQSYGVGLTQLSLTPNSVGSVSANISEPNGTALSAVTCYSTSSPGCADSLSGVPLTGTYGIAIYPGGQATMGVAVTLSQDVTGTLAVGTPDTITLSAAGQNALLTFTVAAGQSASLSAGSVTTSPGGTAVIFYVYNSAGQLVTQTSLAASGSILGSVAAGTYTILVAPNSAATANVQLTLAPGSSGSLPANGTTLDFATGTAGQTATLTFSATAGQDLNLALTGLALSPGSPNYVIVYMYEPNGTNFWNADCYVGAGCDFPYYLLPQTGTYTVQVKPVSSSQTMSFAATLTTDITGGALTLNTPTTVNLNQLGQNEVLTFAATAGQTVALEVSGITITPASTPYYVYVYNPSGALITTTSTATTATLNLPNLVAGTYSVLLFPSTPATATMQVAVYSGAAALMPNNGTATNFSTSAPGQIAYLSFSATAGQDLNLALTGLALSPGSPNYVTVYMYEPNGTNFWNVNCYVGAGCDFPYYNLPQTGTYSIQVRPVSASQTMSFATTMTTDITGSLTLNTPASVTLNQLGQNEVLTFAATAGQTVALEVSGISSTPANTPYYVYVYNPSGTLVSSTSTASTTTLNLTNLVAGTYSVLLFPSTPATATMQVAVYSGATGLLPVNGTPTNYSTSAPGQDAYVTFSATAGQAMSLALTNMSLTPSVGGSMTIGIYYPNGSFFENWSCVPSATGCEGVFYNLAQTGTYTLVVPPINASQTMSFTATAQQPATGSLVANTPQSISLNTVGQLGVYTFTATAGQSLQLDIGSVATTPANATIEFNLYHSNGSYVTYTTTVTGTTWNLNNLSADTYQILIFPLIPATTTFQATIN